MPMSEPVETPRRNLTNAALPALAAAALAGLGVLVLVGQGRVDNGPPAAIPNCILEGADGVGGPIDLVDHNGARVTQADFAGEPAILYFGFTHCPDVCPISMNLLNEALQQPGGYDVQTVLISLDPERDTPRVLRDYVATAGFPPGLIGLTGTPAQVAAATEAFQVYSARAGGDPTTYAIDHTSMIYVLDRQWHTVAMMPTVARSDGANTASAVVGAPVGDLAACIGAGLERSRSD